MGCHNHNKTPKDIYGKPKYNAIINDMGDNKLVYFWMVTDTNMKQLENSKETQ
jgi:hypothetical protein